MKSYSSNMPCTKCNAEFTLLNWKLKCFECEENYCSKCLKKIESDLHCEVCEILIKRPPSRSKLMELKSKDIQIYLKRHNISTHGIVEKQELVELFYKSPIPPIRNKKAQRRFANPLSGSVPNISTRYFSTFRSNAEAAFNSRNWTTGQSANNSPYRSPQSPTDQVPSENVNPLGSQGTQEGVAAPAETIPLRSHSPVHSISEQNFQVRCEPSPQQPRKHPKLSDFETADDLNDLSVKELKVLLSLNRVDYKGCVEKAELLERAGRLWNDSHLRKGDDGNCSVDECCKICMDAPLDCVLLECGHMATCIECGKRLAECPICRQYVIRVVRTFKA